MSIMPATAILKQKSRHDKSMTATAPKLISWEEFQKKYLTREDSYKYEWLNGVVEKTKRAMDYTQFFIINNLQKLFKRLEAQGKADGLLVHEGDIFFLENHRRPDIAFISAAQIARTAYGENQVPAFVIEVISSNDQINKVHEKMENYRAAGVQVAWHIFPKLQEVHVYSGSQLNRCDILKGEELCSAAPVLPDFALSVNELFKKPPMPQ